MYSILIAESKFCHVVPREGSAVGVERFHAYGMRVGERLFPGELRTPVREWLDGRED
jgi:hypothetical protein